MQLQARVQGNFPFLGIQRKPGDTITASELAQTTQQVRDALVAQRLIVLVDEHGADIAGPGDPVTQEQFGRLSEQVQGIGAMLERLLEAKSEDRRAAPKPAKTAKKTKKAASRK